MMPALELYRGQAEEWDAFVRRCDGWTHFHLSGWREVMEEVFGHECPYLIARDADGALKPPFACEGGTKPGP